MSKKRKRLDLLLTERGLAESRSRAQGMIMAGLVLVDDEPVDKAGSLVSEDSKITLKQKDHPYVSRGGVKLERALEEFSVDPKGLVCLDIGASTGGFTDCLLKHGAKKVWSVDVGVGQMDYRLREDDRVTLLEGVNAREMNPDMITDNVDLLVADVSFISLRLVIPPALPALKDDAKLILLVKPQFEAGREKVGKGGVVRDKAVRESVVEDLARFFSELGLSREGAIESPISGRKGNIEYFIYLKKQAWISEGGACKIDVDKDGENN